MKNTTILLFLLMSSVTYAQDKSASDFNLPKSRVAVQGYDVVSYFTQKKSIAGDKKFTITYDDVNFQFSSKENLELFKINPTKYIPQYGGFCAYAIGKTGKKVDINPKTFEIRDGKLYLFYNSWGTNTLELWLKEGAEKLQKQADKNWKF